MEVCQTIDEPCWWMACARRTAHGHCSSAAGCGASGKSQRAPGCPDLCVDCFTGCIAPVPGATDCEGRRMTHCVSRNSNARRRAGEKHRKGHSSHHALKALVARAVSNDCQGTHPNQ